MSLRDVNRAKFPSIGRRVEASAGGAGQGRAGKGAIVHPSPLAGDPSSLRLLAADLSHDIRNVLAVIKTFTGILPHKWVEAEFRDRFLSRVPKELDRLERLVEDLDHFCQEMEVRQDELRLEPLVREMLAEWEGELHDRQIHASTHFPSDLPAIVGDRAQLHRAFANLLIRSIRQMEAGGRFVIEASKQPNATLEVVIRDTVPTRGSFHVDLLNPLDPLRYRGMGLGTLCAVRIFRAHGAKVEVSGMEGMGTQFNLCFPAIESLP